MDFQVERFSTSGTNCGEVTVTVLKDGNKVRYRIRESVMSDGISIMKIDDEGSGIKITPRFANQLDID